MEERLNELEERLEKLERKERNRTILSVVKLGLYLILIGALSFGAYKVYEKVMEVYEPYKEIVDKYNETDKTIKSITDIFK